MEARLAAVLAFVLLIRLPFLNHPIQGDDVYYLAIAHNVAIDPLHPMQMGYTFQGVRVSMAGHPHPPLNAYILGLLSWMFGGAREVPFHAAYILFSLIAAAAVYRLAQRFTDHPALATALFAAAPAFVVNGNSLEADLPFLAFWMAGFALYFDGRHRLAALSLAMAALGAYQAVFATPILAHHVWYRRRRSKTAWLVVLAAPLALVVWQVLQRVSSGEAPAGVLAGYLKAYGLLAILKKLQSALALVSHLGWIVFPAAAPWPAVGAVGAVVAAVLPGYAWWQRVILAVGLAASVSLLWRWGRMLWRERERDEGFLAAWGLVFFAGAAAVFFAGSARYLLPMAAPVVFTVVRSSRKPWLLWGAAAMNLALGLALAAANYNHWQQYRNFAEQLRPLAKNRQVWTSGEWGFRYYLEQQLGAEAVLRDQPVYPGALVVSSELAGRVPVMAGGRVSEVRRAELWSSPALRLIGLGTRSGYSSSDFGVLPFDLGRGLLDRVKAEMIVAAEPKLSYLRLGDPESADQLLAGFYQIEENAWRWMAPEGVVTLKVPEAATRFEMTLFIPDMAPARRITIASSGVTFGTQDFSAPGRHTVSIPVKLTPGDAQIRLEVDRGFQPAGADERRLGLIVQELGLRQGAPE